ADAVREAAAQLANEAVRVVLIDMKLPTGDGAKVYRLVRRVNPKARAVVITGHRSEMEEKVRQILAEGADAVCYKPFDVTQLLDTLARLSGERNGDGAAM